MPFKILYDAPSRRLTLRLNGFWNERTLSAFEIEIRALFSRLQHLPNYGGRVLVDVSGFEVQTRDAVNRIAAVTGAVSGKVDRFALVSSGSALQRRQIERILPADRLYVFRERAAAIAWLSASSEGEISAEAPLCGGGPIVGHAPLRSP